MTDAEPLLKARTGTAYDAFTERLARDPRLRRMWGWLAPTLITALAAILRFWNLGHPRAIVFDETYYIKDAWSQWMLGFASTWPDGADEMFLNGQTEAFLGEGSYAVHPPLGKWLIGAGMALFGPDSSFGWRFAVAVLGTASVLVLFHLAKTLTGSLAVSSIAAGLMAIDGLSIAMSRVAILDVILTFFVVLAFWFALLDRRRHLDRLAAAVVAREHHLSWGPALWNRPWLVAAGAAAGAACAVKWSGVWVLAAIGLWAVVTDALARRRLGIDFWPADAAFRQGPIAFVLLVPIAAVVYLASWTGWLVTDGGYGRQGADATPATGVWAWVPLPLQSLWRLHEQIYGSMAGMSSPHGYSSPAWQWPLLMRPTSMYAQQSADGVDSCAAAAGCIQNIYSMPNPLVWWAAMAAIVYLVVRVVRYSDWRAAFVLVAIAATYVPWLLFPERTIFQFYTVVILPFALLGLALALHAVAGPKHAPAHRRALGQRLVLVFLFVAALVGAFWYPIVVGATVPMNFWQMHNWLQGWV